MTGERVPAGDKAECRGDDCGEGETEDGVGSSSHPEHGYHRPHCTQPECCSFQVSRSLAQFAISPSFVAL